MDNIEQNPRMIFGEEEAEEYRQRSQHRTISVTSEPSLQGSDISDEDELDRTFESEESAALSEAAGDSEGQAEWEEGPFVPIDVPSTPPSPGLLVRGTASMTPFQYFQIFFNLSFLRNLACMTNEHAEKIITGTIMKPESRLRRWKATTAEEILTFLGILFFMGTVTLSKINDYWKKSHLVSFNLRKYMSRNRFLIILRMLYFNYESTSTHIYDKVDPLIEYFNNTMKGSVYPERELTIDESMVLFRGRLAIRQYIKNKRHKYGIKLYILADPKGLVHRIHMYRGSADSEVSGTGHAKKVVLKLTEDFINAGHSLYMDNYYNSVDLAETLLRQNTYCTGTLQVKSKGNPVTVTSKRLTRGSVVYRKNRNGVCVMKWKDKRDVLTLSTEHTPDILNTTNWRGHGMLKPEIIIKYNKFMKGVDRYDQMLSYYPSEHKTIRWYKKIGIHIMQMMFLNSYFMFNGGTGKNISLESYRNEVLRGLLPPPISRIDPPALPTHMPKELNRNSNGVLKRRKCVRCWSVHKKRKDSGMFCPDCDVGLCIACYGAYHIENKLLP
ncbi:piggyBac transposable element-derived protein 4-like [Spodoptera litura]|uniref:PiggyBac transposable element-derived protein 4-like n=1 Tax=Spodoptera litura TaxID=69820 RepID=A0A9J7ISY4_SPOLT|nr:piggyBac transposable element-derived protein 4-like [Spodoptera litura]